MAMQRREFLNFGTLLAGGALLTSRVAFARDQAPGPSTREAGVAHGHNVPLVMRGPDEVTSWSASKLGALDEDTLARITDLYAADPLLSVRLADALAANAIASADGAGSLAALAPDTAVRDTSAAGVSQPARPAQANGARYAQVVRAAAGFLRQEAGPIVAMSATT